MFSQSRSNDGGKGMKRADAVAAACSLCLLYACTVAEQYGQSPKILDERRIAGNLPEMVLPTNSVLNECTIDEAMFIFTEWYEHSVSPTERTFSFVVEGLPPEYRDRKRTVDVSGLPMDQALLKIVESFGMTLCNTSGLYHIRLVGAAMLETE